MCFFKKPEKPQYGKVIAITVGSTLAIAAAAYAAYRFFANRCCEYCCDDCCDCDDDDLFCDEDDDDSDDVEVEVEDAHKDEENGENA